MNTRILRNLKISLIMLFLILILDITVFCQQNQKSDKKPAVRSETITTEQTQQIKKILSGYNASKLTAADAKEIQEKFRIAGIHAGPEINSAITASGFDPEKLRSLAPPPDKENKPRSSPPSIDERMKIIDEKIIKHLSLSDPKKELLNKAFREFYGEMDKLPNPPANSQTSPDKSNIEHLEKTRDAKIKQTLSAEQYKKYLELKSASRPNKADKNQKQK